ncbi:MYG1 protein [Diplocarpon rosae]|nr:MYG1 protein [Diplocarpon rosae]
MNPCPAAHPPTLATTSSDKGRDRLVYKKSPTDHYESINFYSPQPVHSHSRSKDDCKMNPHQKNKVDVASLSPDEQRLFRLYGKLPSKADHLSKQLKDRKYFDSGDYALSKAGKASSVDTGCVGSQHPLPENIPHLSSPGVGNASQGGSGNGNIVHSISSSGLPGGSPVKESSFLNRETSVDEAEDKEKKGERATESASPPPVKEGISIGR